MNSIKALVTKLFHESQRTGPTKGHKLELASRSSGEWSIFQQIPEAHLRGLLLLCWDCYLLLFSWPSANIWSSSSTVLFFLSLRAFSTVSFAHGSGALVDGEDSVELIICSRLQWKIRFQHQDILITMPYSTDFSHWTSEANQQTKV